MLMLMWGTAALTGSGLALGRRAQAKPSSEHLSFAICSATLPRTCHPEAPSFGDEGSMHSAGSADTADNSIDPSVRNKARTSG